MNFTSKFNIGDWVQFVNDKEVRGMIKTVSFSKDLGTYYSAKLDNGDFQVGIREIHLEKVERLFKFAGHKVTQGNDKSKVQIGCKTVTKLDVENLLDLADRFDIFDMTISTHGDDEIRIDQVRELYSKFFQNNTQQKLLESFLAQKGALGRFNHNLITQKIITPDELAKISPSGKIAVAFTWSLTPEGDDFWRSVNADWIKYFNEKE